MKYLVIFLCFTGLLLSCSEGEDAETLKEKNKRERENIFALARDPTWYPLEFYGKSDYVSAFIDDFCIEISKVKRVHFSLFPATFSTMFHQLQRGTYEGLISSLTPSDTNMQEYVFSDPIIFLGPVLVVRKDSNANSVGDMEGLVLLVPDDKELIINVSQSSSTILKTYSNIGDALSQILLHKADGALVENITATTYTDGLYREKLKIVTPPLTDLALRLIAPVDSPRGKELIDVFNEGLRVLKQNGVYYYLKRKWNIKEKFE